MKTLDYAMFFRRPINVERIAEELPHFDVFVSAFNSSDRVNITFQEISASSKYWLVHPEYSYIPIEYPSGSIVAPSVNDEVTQVGMLLDAIGSLDGKTICIDITGFMRHVLAFLIAKLSYIGVKAVTAVYSEPTRYLKQEDTVFSTKTTGRVSPVAGMAGSTSVNGSDFLILGVGYDQRLMSEVVNCKDSSTVFPLFSFPSLSPDMYQQSAIRASDCGDVALEENWTTNRKFAPANDPFSIAEVLTEIVDGIVRKYSSANVYLAPLATKVQTLGFAIFWLLQRSNPDFSLSLLLPQCLTYSRETSSGIKRLWAYEVELD